MATQQAWSQYAIGLYEGLMGRSGAAMQESTAASFYNPSLLIQRSKSSYTVSGNSVGGVQTKSNNVEVNSFTFQPTYMSSIMAYENSVHEFYLVNTSPTSYELETKVLDSASTYLGQQKVQQTQILFGYSMAFRSLPMGFNFYGSITDKEGFGFAEYTSLVSDERSTVQTKSDFNSLGVGFSMGTHVNFNSYSIGFHLKTRQIYLAKHDEENVSTYVHTGLSPTDYYKVESKNTNQSTVVNGHEFIVGHSWAVGDHEFLSDTTLTEKSDLTAAYEAKQSFGYKLKFDSESRFLVGMSHILNNPVRYLGQAMYVSTGYSWASPTLRNVVGFYFTTNRLEQDFYAYGLTFGSEFRH